MDGGGGSKSPIRRTSSILDDDDDDDDGDTQLFDSQSWCPKINGEDGGGRNDSSQSTLPMNDTVVFEEAFETQVVDFAGETQVMDFGCETQVVDLGGETQVLDDIDCVEHMGTQLLDSSENEKVGDIGGEESDRTEGLSDDDDDLVRKVVGLSGDTEKVQSSSVSKDSEKGSKDEQETPSNVQNNSGFHASTATHVLKPKQESRPVPFTSVRAASLRASGLASRNSSMKDRNCVSSSKGNQSPEISVAVNNSVSTNLGNGIRNESSCGGNDSAVRKLYYGGEDEELVGGGKDSTELPGCDLAGLSYVGSQEPGELTQANALDFLDRFVKESVAGFDEEETERGKSTGGKSRCLSSVKGMQKLARKANEKSMAEDLGIYDWDDSREDEGGGEILRRINKDISGSSKSLGRKPSSSRRKMEIFNSDSKLQSRTLKFNDISTRESKTECNRNLISVMNAESGVECRDKRLVKDATKRNVADMSDNIRFDTQMAAEAMEALFFGEGISTDDPKKESSSYKEKKRPSYRKRACPNDEDSATVQSRKFRTVDDILNNGPRISSEKRPRNVRDQTKEDNTVKKSQKATENGLENSEKKSRDSVTTTRVRPPKRGMKGLDGYDSSDRQCKRERVDDSGPIARRTRRSVEPVAYRTRRSVTSSSFTDAVNVNRSSGRGPQTSKTSTSNEDVLSSRTETFKTNLNKKFEKAANLTDNSNEIDTLSCPKRRRSIRKLSQQVEKSDNVDDPPEPLVDSEVSRTSIQFKRSSKKTLPSVNQGSVDKSSLRSDKMVFGHAENVQTSERLDESPREKSNLFNSTCATPVNCKIPTNDISPICMGDEYLTQSRTKSRFTKSVLREIQKLNATEPRRAISPSKYLRKKREITDVRVLYSHHLDEDIVKHQKKILARLGVSVAASMADATHFVADQFVRTRNLLEAIASGKPVVTHLWLDSCGQANCFIDEKHYILRDAKKEKEYGFCMPNSLASALQRPLLQGLRVLVTPNTKPGVEIISNLVKAVQGQVVERIGGSAMKDGSFPDDLLIISCEEDYAICVPFLEQGATIYSSELLLNGIVVQKLEYDRYQLFVDHVRKTRSTTWFKKEGNKFLPVSKTS